MNTFSCVSWRCALAAGLVAIAPSLVGAQVPMDDHFDTTLGPEWVVERGNPTIQNGWLVLVRQDFGSPRDTAVTCHDGDTTMTDYVFHARVDPVLTPSPWGGPWNRAGVLFRTTDAWGPNFTAYGVSFILPGDSSGWSRVHLSRAVNGVGTELAVVTPFAPTTEPMEVVVRAIGHNIKVYVNGSVLFDVNDPAGPLAGGIGFWNVWESEGHYDDVFVATIPPICPGDADGNKSVEFADITAVLANFLSTCP